MIKRKHKPNGHQNSSANNGGHASDNEEHKRRSEKEEARLKTDPSQLAMDVTSARGPTSPITALTESSPPPPWLRVNQSIVGSLSMSDATLVLG